MRDKKAFINTATTKHRAYRDQDIPLQQLIDAYSSEREKAQEENEKALNEQMKSLVQERDADQIPGFDGEKIALKDILEQGLNGGVNINLSLFDNEINTIQQDLDKLAEGLCNGFSFGGSNNCQGLPVPFNQAILAPGDYHLFGCYKLPLSPLDGGLPVFHFPGSLTPALPIPIPR
jgi:hypothetical protein